MNPQVKKSDWVHCKLDPTGPVGFVRRVAKDGEWADVDWHSHTKRMKTAALEVLHTIPFVDCVVTDMTRMKELEQQKKDDIKNE